MNSLASGGDESKVILQVYITSTLVLTLYIDVVLSLSILTFH